MYYNIKFTMKNKKYIKIKKYFMANIKLIKSIDLIFQPISNYLSVEKI